ncbi:MAG: helix-turn-helix domain-containing protein [Gammaproteobacteria bacterium]|jgi:AraC family transcriptional regulator, ethanolamine operon transcriptional activator|nr:helix-turn-helix domain-containing protein [Gammaproteobacteria bacterium]MBU1846332.1 helix-turn-helix domain-containing protein [Gammaproteobacteria bacterium]
MTMGQGFARAHRDTGNLRVRLSHDVAEHADNISRWHQEYEQLSGGVFAGCVREMLIEGPSLQVFHEYTQQETSQQCGPWAGSVWMGLPDLSRTGEVRFCGRAHADGVPLMMARASSGFSLRTPRSFGIYGIVADERWLASRLAGRDGRHLEYLLTHGSVASRPVSPSRHSELCFLIEGLLQRSDGNANGANAEALCVRLVDLLLDSLGDAPHPPARTVLEQRRFDIVMQARDIALRPDVALEGVDDLCGRLHVTRRTLQNHFNCVLGMAPKDYLKRVRLNAVRRELQHGGDPARCVHDIATRWGFWHLGHFSHDYRTLFGELPSMTLRRALAPAQQLAGVVHPAGQ